MFRTIDSCEQKPPPNRHQTYFFKNSKNIPANKDSIQMVSNRVIQASKRGHLCLIVGNPINFASSAPSLTLS